jgi:hypothetical protein
MTGKSPDYPCNEARIRKIPRYARMTVIIIRHLEQRERSLKDNGDREGE